MRNLTPLEIYRMRGRDVMSLWGWEGDETCGAFLVPSCIDRALLKVIASSGEGWDHVSVSRQHRCPNWQEMEQIAALFFKDDETAMQLHVPRSDHINLHPYCLHWWRPLDAAIPRPPAIMVGGTPEQVDASDDLVKAESELAALRERLKEADAVHARDHYVSTTMDWTLKPSIPELERWRQEALERHAARTQKEPPKC